MAGVAHTHIHTKTKRPHFFTESAYQRLYEPHRKFPVANSIVGFFYKQNSRFFSRGITFPMILIPKFPKHIYERNFAHHDELNIPRPTLISLFLGLS